jgi:hypothetical protein
VAGVQQVHDRAVDEAAFVVFSSLFFGIVQLCFSVFRLWQKR